MESKKNVGKITHHSSQVDVVLEKYIRLEVSPSIHKRNINTYFDYLSVSSTNHVQSCKARAKIRKLISTTHASQSPLFTHLSSAREAEFPWDSRLI